MAVRRGALSSAVALALLCVAPAARALAPGELYAVSGVPGQNAFLPGPANESFLGGRARTTSFIETGNTRKISDDGRYVVFVSLADGLSPADDDRFINVYIQDRDTGAIEVASTPAPGGSSEGDAGDPAISGDGRSVAFTSDARLSPQDTDAAPDVYLRDLDAGTTKLISVTTGGAQGDGANSEADLSHDGSTVAFTSTVATSFSADDADTTPDVYIASVATGALALISRATTAGGAKSNGSSSEPAISGNGGAVAFQSTATNLDGDDADTTSDVFLRSGTATSLVSRATTAAGAKGNAGSFDPAISNGGVFVAFTSLATNLAAPDVSGSQSVFLRDTGANTTALVSQQSGISANGASVGATISSSGGTHVAFTSDASNLGTAGDDAHAWVRDVGGDTTTLVSRLDGATGAPAQTVGVPSIATLGTAVAFSVFDATVIAEDDDNFGSVFARDGSTTTWRSRPPSGAPWRGGAAGAGLALPGGDVSSDGRYVAFVSSSDAYLPPGTDPISLLLVRDLQTGAITIASRRDGSAGAPVQVYEATLSADGTKVAFSSRDQVVEGVPADTFEIYLRDLVNGTTRLVTESGGVPADDDSFHPSISADGRYVAFDTRAPNLDASISHPQVYRHDMTTDDVLLVSRAAGADGAKVPDGASSPSISADGSRVAFATADNTLDPSDTDTKYSVYLRDIGAATTALVSKGPAGANDDFASDAIISADGSRVAFLSSAKNLDPADTDTRADVYVADVAAGTSSLASQPGNGAFSINRFAFSSDGSTVAWPTAEPLVAEDTDTFVDAYTRDIPTGTTTLAGRKATGAPLDGGVSSVGLSGDGGCLAMTITGPGEYGEGPLPSPDLPGSAPSPDFQEVLLRALKPTCARSPTGPGGGPGSGADTTAPVITKVSLTRKRFRRSAKATAISAARRRRAKAGTTLRFTLSEAARVTVAFQRKTAGRRVRGKCRKATPGRRRLKRCTRYVAAGRITRASLPAGANRIALSGRLGRKRMKLGPYRLTLRALDAAGNRSAPKRLTFRLVRR